ncbi:hypothetical protein BC628DRAFT_1188130 [Trametes gibbosa]|nr:hypothetical protein BC628DRAFT_1188130 [Trametes gibbosa]
MSSVHRRPRPVPAPTPTRTVLLDAAPTPPHTSTRIPEPIPRPPPPCAPHRAPHQTEYTSQCGRSHSTFQVRPPIALHRALPDIRQSRHPLRHFPPLPAHLPFPSLAATDPLSNYFLRSRRTSDSPSTDSDLLLGFLVVHRRRRASYLSRLAPSSPKCTPRGQTPAHAAALTHTRAGSQIGNLDLLRCSFSNSDRGEALDSD